MKKIQQILPGVLLCLGIILLSNLVAEWFGRFILQVRGIGGGASPISGVFIAIIFGLTIRNIIGLREIFRNGASFSIKYILRFGIILLGVRLSFLDVVTLGAWGLPIILVCVSTGLLCTMWITNKLNQPKRLGTLIAVGTGICGVTAIVGTSPGIKANDEEVAYAIANITIFGIVAMFLYPYLAYYLFQNDPIKAGLFLGTAIHETAQVAGAALIYDQLFSNEKVIYVATIAKLTRNVLLVAVVPLMSYLYLNKLDSPTENLESRPKWYQLTPVFVLGFIALATMRTIGDATVSNTGAAFGLFSLDQWKFIWSNLSLLGTKYMLGIAMAGIGLSTNLSIFKDLGIKPFYIGMISTLVVTSISIIMVYFLGDFIKF